MLQQLMPFCVQEHSRQSLTHSEPKACIPPSLSTHAAQKKIDLFNEIPFSATRPRLQLVRWLDSPVGGFFRSFSTSSTKKQSQWESATNPSRQTRTRRVFWGKEDTKQYLKGEMSPCFSLWIFVFRKSSKLVFWSLFMSVTNNEAFQNVRVKINY
jgi:hypothetical protein